MPHTNKVLLIDADIFAYRFAVGHEYNYQKYNERHREDEDFEEAFLDDIVVDRVSAYIAFDKHIRKCVKDTGCKRIHFVISSSSNFRKEVYTEYKANRAEVPDPLLRKELKEYILENYSSEVAPEGLEADDRLGILASELGKDKCVIASIDKDLRQIAGWHYNWDKRALEEVEPFEALVTYYTQVITGDTVDNYKGIQGKGKIFATQLIEAAIEDWEDDLEEGWDVSLPEVIEERIEQAYEEAGLSKEYLEQMKKVAKILDKWCRY